jgi:hypothetical protein
VRRCLVALSSAGLIEIKPRKGTSNKYFLRVDTSVQRGVDTSGRTVRPPASYYTKEIHKKKTKRRNINELAG